MAFFKETLSASTKEFKVRSKSSVTGQKNSLSGTVFVEGGGSLALEGDLGDGTFVSLQTFTAGSAVKLTSFNAEIYRISGTGTFILNSDLLLEEL